MESKGGPELAIFVSFVLVMIWQYAIILTLSSMIILNLITSEHDNKFTAFEWIGLIMVIIGLLLEFVADCQLYNFKKLERNKGKILKEGLWKY